ncbi:MAG: hypothetical protein JRN33_06380 [Nitrososphaerota archaeon]|nr:hypothetical protein [Nitrososphaerota archaeon]
MRVHNFHGRETAPALASWALGPGNRRNDAYPQKARQAVWSLDLVLEGLGFKTG